MSLKNLILMPNLKKTFKSAIVKVLQKCGYKITRIDRKLETGIIDLSNVTCDPIEAFYRAGFSGTSNKNSWVVIKVNSSLTRSPYMLSISPDGDVPDPFVADLRNYFDNYPKVPDFKNSSLYNYYQVWQPANAAEYLGIASHSSVSNELLCVPPFGSVLPWDWDSPEERLKGSNIGAEGWQQCGPVSEDKAYSEFLRFMNTAKSIFDNGYQRTIESLDGDIAGTVLVSGSEFRVLIADGCHRYAVLKALNYPSIPICLRRWPLIVRREDAMSWPNVVSGLFSSELALSIFDRVFAGKQQPEYLSSINKYS